MKQFVHDHDTNPRPSDWNSRYHPVGQHDLQNQYMSYLKPLSYTNALEFVAFIATIRRARIYDVDQLVHLVILYDKVRGWRLNLSNSVDPRLSPGN